MGVGGGEGAQFADGRCGILGAVDGGAGHEDIGAGVDELLREAGLAAPVVDPNALEDLLETMGPDAGKLFETFLKDSAGRVGRVRDRLAAGDFRAVEVELHSLSGAAGTLGLPALVAASERLRTAIAGSRDGTDGAQASLGRMMDRLDTALAEARRVLLSRELAA